MQSFKQYLRKLDEDAMQQAAEIDAMIAATDNQLAKLTKPLNDRKVLLTKKKQMLLPQLEKEREASQKTASGVVQPTTGSQTKTPGSAGAQTPGVSPG